MPLSRTLRYTAAGLGGAILLVVGLTVLPLRRPAAPPPHGTTGGTDTIYIHNAGYHTALLLPRTIGRHQLDTMLAVEADGQRWISLGWGDREFFMAGSIEPMLALQALTGCGRSTVIHAAATTPAADDRALAVTRPQLERLLGSCRRWIARDSVGAVLRLRDGYYGRASAFLASYGSYSVAATCNQWVADRLSEAGFTTPLYCPLPWSVMGIDGNGQDGIAYDSPTHGSD